MLHIGLYLVIVLTRDYTHKLKTHYSARYAAAAIMYNYFVIITNRVTLDCPGSTVSV